MNRVSEVRAIKDMAISQENWTIDRGNLTTQRDMWQAAGFMLVYRSRQVFAGQGVSAKDLKKWDEGSL